MVDINFSVVVDVVGPDRGSVFEELVDDTRMGVRVVSALSLSVGEGDVKSWSSRLVVDSSVVVMVEGKSVEGPIFDNSRMRSLDLKAAESVLSTGLSCIVVVVVAPPTSSSGPGSRNVVVGIGVEETEDAVEVC